jgi:NADH-quinone oxidoreductase subunit L
MKMFLDTPAYFFVAATLLPLASFAILLLLSGLWSLARRYEWEGLQKSLSSEEASKGAAYLAIAAIGLAAVCSFAGAYLYWKDLSHHLELKHHAEHEVHHLKASLTAAQKANDEKKAASYELRLEEAKSEEHRIEHEWEKLRKQRWEGRLYKVFELNTSGSYDPERSAFAEIGYKIDSLSVLMFCMVTFVATLIHLFSSAYMSEELPAEGVADHHVHTEDGHLHRRGRYARFFMYLSLFCFSMLNLVLADNLFQVFVSWELVGICSFLLIGFYFERQSASNAANKAFITNRVGDAGFILGLLICWGYLGTLNFDRMFAQVRHPMEDAHHEAGPLAGRIVRGEPDPEAKAPTVKVSAPGEGGSVAVLFPLAPLGEEHDGRRVAELKKALARAETEAEKSRITHELAVLRTHFHNATPGSRVKVGGSGDRMPEEHGSMPYWMLVAAGLGVFLGCMGKSAQFPLQVWLPDAMEGPTPVSALIHAATMVAAGVYLVGRCFPLFTPEVLVVIAYIGGITLFVAATIAIVATDIKKVLAYSTVSQLGYMMLALGIGGWVAGLFHLITHAVFKALLFLGSGSVIHGCHHEQEMTKMGGLYNKMRITALTMLMGVLAIAGIPLFSGWYSKDAILAQAAGYAHVHPHHALLFLLPLATAGITTFYMFRMWLMTFTGKPRDHHVYDHAHESPWQMTVPLTVLAFLSVTVAWSFTPWVATSSWLEHAIHTAQPVSVMADFGAVHEHHEHFPTEASKPDKVSERHWAHEYHDAAGMLALLMVAIGLTFALLLYYFNVLNPDEAREQFPGVYAFLVHKWYFDEVYSVLVVRPAMVVARAFRWFDLTCIDGALHGTARGTMAVSTAHGAFDRWFIDWLVNLVARVTRAVGNSLRVVQTGYLRSYVLFLALAAAGLFVLLAWLVSSAKAG